MKAIAYLTLFLLPGLSIAADYPGSYTAEQLLELCSGSKAETKFCTAFVAGVRSGAAAQRLYIGFELGREHKDKGAMLKWLLTHEPFCSRSEITDSDLVSAFLELSTKAQKNNPEFMKAGAGFSVLTGAYHKYPCN